MEKTAHLDRCYGTLMIHAARSNPDLTDADMMRACTQDTGNVPHWLIPALTAYARSIGFRVLWEWPTARPDVIGQTDGDARTIKIRGDMTDASRAHTLIHEIAHAHRFAHGTSTPDLITDSILFGENKFEECLAEVTAGIVVSALGCSDLRAPAGYLANRLDVYGPSTLIAVRTDAIIIAGQILDYVTSWRDQ